MQDVSVQSSASLRSLRDPLKAGHTQFHHARPIGVVHSHPRDEELECGRSVKSREVLSTRARSMRGESERQIDHVD